MRIEAAARQETVENLCLRMQLENERRKNKMEELKKKYDDKECTFVPNVVGKKVFKKEIKIGKRVNPNELFKAADEKQEEVLDDGKVTNTRVSTGLK